MVLDPIPQSLPVHFFGSRPQPPTSLLIYVLCIARRYHQSLCVLDEDMHLACPMSRMSHLSTNETSTWQMRHEHCLMGHTSCVCHVCVCLMGTYKGVWRACRCSMEENDIFTCVRRCLRADDTHTNSLSLSHTHTISYTHTHTHTYTHTHTHTHKHKHTRIHTHTHAHSHTHTHIHTHALSGGPRKWGDFVGAAEGMGGGARACCGVVRTCSSADAIKCWSFWWTTLYYIFLNSWLYVYLNICVYM